MRNIIFDFGNVLVEWHPERVYGEYFGEFVMPVSMWLSDLLSVV